MFYWPCRWCPCPCSPVEPWFIKTYYCPIRGADLMDSSTMTVYPWLRFSLWSKSLSKMLVCYMLVLNSSVWIGYEVSVVYTGASTVLVTIVCVVPDVCTGALVDSTNFFSWTSWMMGMCFSWMNSFSDSWIIGICFSWMGLLDQWLHMFMNNLLMMLMDQISVCFFDNVLMMFMNDLWVLLSNQWSFHMLPNYCTFLMS